MIHTMQEKMMYRPAQLNRISQKLRNIQLGKRKLKMITKRGNQKKVEEEEKIKKVNKSEREHRGKKKQKNK